ncbi:MAG: c-type cytochrome [Actinobacteria bacterium]|nr:MAG: c-type cytochrome [Actinomycetota bacterium]
MTATPLRILLTAGVVVPAALLALATVSATPPTRAVTGDHATVHLARGDMTRVLQAAEAVTTSTPRDELVAEGRKLFRSTSMATAGESCQTCHTEGSATANLGTIPHPRADIANDFTGPRDAPALWGIAKTAPYFWNGDVLTLQEAATTAVINHFDDFVRGSCQATNGDVNGPRPAGCLEKAGRLGASIRAYLEQLDPPVSRFDQGTLTEPAQRGEALFQGKGGCISCHGGPQFTDNLIHDTGVPKTSPRDSDPGAGPPPLPAGCRVVPQPAGCSVPVTKGPFINTPQLRDLKHTAPYMHNGVFKTLHEVVAFYNKTSLLSPMNLTDAEMDDLVAYLSEL